MDRYIDIPARPGFPSISLSARISNPSDPTNTEIDPNYPTILFVCPILTDNLVYYSQFEDPLLAERFNLVSFEPRGTCRTYAPDMEDEYGWAAVGEDLYQGMRGMGIENAHFLGQGLALLGIMQLACSHPEAVASMTLICLQVESEVKAYIPAYDVLETLRVAYAERDAELFEEMMHAAWGQHVGRYSKTSRIEELLEHTVDVYREQLLNGTLDKQYPYLKSLMGRHQVDLPTDEQIRNVRCPTLFIFSDLEEFKSTGYVDNFNSILNRLAPSEDRPLGRIQWLESGYLWLANCMPQTINPILHDFATSSTRPRQSSISRSLSVTPRRHSSKASASGKGFHVSPIKTKFDHSPSERPSMDMASLRVTIETEVTVEGGGDEREANVGNGTFARAGVGSSM